MELVVKVWSYVDGFNLYNGAAKPAGCKWLDLLKLSRSLVPNDDVERVKYFTAQVDARVNDPDQPVRQRTYWRALRTLGCVDIIEGRFLTKRTQAPEAASIDHMAALARAGVSVVGTHPTMVDIYRSEEKGTDVNLATHLVHDAHLGRFDAALVVSNDSDLCEAIRIVKSEIGKVVIVYTPHRKRPSSQLRAVATLFRELRPSHLSASLLADTLADSRGPFTKPTGW